MADVLVVPQSVRTSDDFEEVLTRLTGFCKPGANVVFTHESVASSALTTKGFHRVFGIEGAVLYKQQPEHVNGVNDTSLGKHDFVIIEPSIPSNIVKSFSKALQNALGEEGHKSVANTWAELSIECADEAKGKTYISLVELETSLLDNLSEPDFEKVRNLISNCDHLLWVNGSHNPSMAVVHGLSRTARNEYASLKFQVLHLSGPETALQHGLSLVVKLSTMSTTDNEFRERDGLLQTSRFFNSVAGNEAVRDCLEDSIHIQSLKDEERPEALRLTIGKPGLLDSLSFIHDDRFDATLGDMEIEVDVKATGINFKDVMASMGLVEVSLIGHEASGVVVATGSKAAERFQIGDRVVVSGEGMHATRLRSDHRLAVKMPDSISFEEAAVMPTVHVIAYHALVNVAKLRPNQSILIHAAAGGVGHSSPP